MYLYGASGHAKVIIELLELQGGEIEGLFDDNYSIHSIVGYPVSPFMAPFKDGKQMIISVGNNIHRKNIAFSTAANYGKAIHPAANLSKRCVIGDGTVVMGGVTINADTIIGKHCIVNTNASIDHDCILDDFVHICPNSTLCGDVKIGEGTMIGAGSVVIPGKTIGKWCCIGAGSVILKDIPDFSTAWGNPARVTGTNVPAALAVK